jgi:DNA-binding HxlR family transcriptional regulator
MLPRSYQGQNCSIARALELIGDRWTVLIVRDVALGFRRFDEIQDRLGVARNVLSDRLARLTEAGVLRKVRYQARPERHEYALTRMGRDLQVAIVALMHWGDRYLAPGAPPRLVEHAGCGGEVVEQLMCRTCRQPVRGPEVTTRPGPGQRARAAR